MSYETPSGGAPYATQTNSTMAIISLVAGILGLTFVPLIGSIVAVITGPMAKKEIRESGGALGGEGLATAGVIMGWIGIGLTVLAICIGGAVFAIPFCAAIFGLSTQGSSFLLSLLL
jgi:hypothetical protein